MITTTLSEENAALGFTSDSAAAKHQAWLEENGTPEFKAWFRNIKVKADKNTAELALLEECEQREREWNSAGYTGKRLPSGAFDIPCCVSVAL